MNAVPTVLADEFAMAYASDTGMSARQIVEFFRAYCPTVRGTETYRPSVPVRRELFTLSLAQLPRAEQWCALADLLAAPPEMKYAGPDVNTLARLRAMLYHGPLGLSVGTAISSLSVREVKVAWLKVISRLPDAPAAAVTAARTMLESACQRILGERGVADASAARGDLPKLVRLTCQSLSVRDGWRREISIGLTSIAGGIASLSNVAGDRHGVVEPTPLDDHEAELIIGAAGTITVFLVREHLQVRTHAHRT